MTDNAGPLLCRAGLITQAQLKTAYETQGRAGGTLAEILIGAQLVDEDRLCDFFRDRLMVPRVGLAELSRVSRRVTAVLPSDMAGGVPLAPHDPRRGGPLAPAQGGPPGTPPARQHPIFTRQPAWARG